jgi:hypothetical protein
VNETTNIQPCSACAAKEAELQDAREALGKALTWQPLVELRTKRAEAAESKLSVLTASLTALVEQEKLMGDPRWLGKQVTALLRKISQ